MLQITLFSAHISGLSYHLTFMTLASVTGQWRQAHSRWLTTL